MKVEIYTGIAEKNRPIDVHQDMLSLFLDHYNTNFPGCIINVYNNSASEKSLKILKDSGCNVLSFSNYDKYVNEDKYTKMKSEAWKSSNADWIIVCDIDELIQINQEELSKLDGVDVVQFKGYHMIDKDSTKDLRQIKHGYPDKLYNKVCLFRQNIDYIKFNQGCHVAAVPKKCNISKLKYNLYHYNVSTFNEENFIEYILKVYLNLNDLKKIRSKYKTSKEANVKLAKAIYKEHCNTAVKLI